MEEGKKTRYHQFNYNNYTDDQLALIEAIEQARVELENAREFFNSVCEPRLIDYAIYMEEAAKVRYAYLLSEAKRLNLRVNYSFRFRNARAV